MQQLQHTEYCQQCTSDNIRSRKYRQISSKHQNRGKWQHPKWIRKGEVGEGRSRARRVANVGQSAANIRTGFSSQKLDGKQRCQHVTHAKEPDHNSSNFLHIQRMLLGNSHQVHFNTFTGYINTFGASFSINHSSLDTVTQNYCITTVLAVFTLLIAILAVFTLSTIHLPHPWLICSCNGGICSWRRRPIKMGLLPTHLKLLEVCLFDLRQHLQSIYLHCRYCIIGGKMSKYSNDSATSSFRQITHLPRHPPIPHLLSHPQTHLTHLTTRPPTYNFMSFRPEVIHVFFPPTTNLSFWWLVLQLSMNMY